MIGVTWQMVDFKGDNDVLGFAIIKRRLVTFKGGFVGPSVCRSVGLSSKNFSKSFEKEVLSIK